MIQTSTFPYARLQKRHHILSYHYVRSMVARGFILMQYLAGKDNCADILKKHWGHSVVYPLLKPIFHYCGNTASFKRKLTATAGMKIEQLVAALVKAKEDAPVCAVEWSKEGDGAELQQLEKAEITMKETLLGKAMAAKLETCVQIIKEVTPEMLEMVALDYGKIEHIKRMQATRSSVMGGEDGVVIVVFWPLDDTVFCPSSTPPLRTILLDAKSVLVSSTIVQGATVTTVTFENTNNNDASRRDGAGLPVKFNRVDQSRAEPPIKRAVRIVVVEKSEAQTNTETNGTIANAQKNSFEDEVLEIELDPEERRLFDTLKMAANAWKEGKLPLEKKTVQIRIAGGWVRDKILGLQTHDVDIALDTCTGVEFAQAVKAFYEKDHADSKDIKEKIGKIGVIAANPAQSKHLETACVRIFGNDVDFSNLRHETYAEHSRIPDTVMGTPLEDSYRRDCTMNALYYNLNTDSIEDWTRRGLEDLMKTKVVYTPLDAVQTFRDDPLRVLRVIRFAVRYEMELSDEIKSASQLPQVHNELRRKVSRERVGNELEGMLSGKHANPAKAMDLICKLHLGGSVLYLPTGVNIIGTIGQTRLEPVPYMQECADEEGLSHLRACAWEETQECLRILSTVLDSFADHPDAITTVDKRLVYLAVFVLPYMKLQYVEKQKTKSVVDYMVRDSIKFKNKDAIYVDLVTQNLDETILLFEQHQRQKSATDGNATLRLQAGLLLRSAKEMWVTTLLVATVVLSRKHEMSLDVAYWYARAKELYETLVIEINLDGCWKTKPLMNGKDLIRFLEVNRGPEIGIYMEEQVKWALTNPTGTIEELHGHLKRFKTNRELRNDDENVQPVLKKMHLE
eukprot:jgi/Psemu1/68937/estExt_Genemark1.C_6400007